MPYQVTGQPGTWYEPGTRKGNTTIAWRGQLPDGKWTEFFTDSTNQPGAEAHRKRVFARWHRNHPPATGAQVDLGTAAEHYKDARARSDAERDRADAIVGWLGKDLDVAAINQTHVTKAGKKFRAQRAAENAQAKAEKRQTYPSPSTETVNREVTTPLRAIVNFATEQGWRNKIVLKAIKPDEGEAPSQPRPAARDDDVDDLLHTIDDKVATLKPIGGRQLNYRRQLASLRALRALVTVVHERGYRISEWLRWGWETVDLARATASILLSKPKRWVEFDFSPDARDALANMPARDQGHVFPWRHRAQVYQAVDRLGIHWRPHESRRAVVIAVIRETGDPALAQKYISHASIKTTLRYRVVEAKEVRPARRLPVQKR
jgi:site-specific recombinase XerD